jgi:predicted XRE-type DNA-binding protein
MKKKNNYTISSGNVFSDLELPNSEEMLTKAELARQINNIIEQKGLTQIAAAKLLEIDQPKISALSKGKLSGFSLERLFRFLNILGQRITIKVTKASSKQQSVTNISIPRSRKSSMLREKKNPSIASAIHARKKNR